MPRSSPLRGAILALLSVAGPALAQPRGGEPPARAVALTFDDLPSTDARELAAQRAITDRLLAALAAERAPAIGFVTEGKLHVRGEVGRRAALLRRWLDAGHDLGNHTFGHTPLREHPVAVVERGVVRGDSVTRLLLAERGRRPRWFRHPTLHTGSDAATKRRFEAFLARRGYRVAPVTFDNQEWVFARAYHLARERGDTAAARCAGEAYVPFMEATFAFFEGLSRRVVGREPAQVLLLHANALNADYLDELLAALRRRGYRFVTLDEAMRDPAYQLPDGYIGPRGPSWLHRWGLARGIPLQPEPREPALIAELAAGRSVRIPPRCDGQPTPGRAGD